MASAWKDRVGLGVVAVLGAALAVGLLAHEFWVARRPGFLTQAAAECRRAYGRAHTAAESAMVDVVHPATGPQKAPTAPTCGTLRATGGSGG